MDVCAREGCRGQQRGHVAGALEQLVDAVEEQLCKSCHLRVWMTDDTESGIREVGETPAVRCRARHQPWWAHGDGMRGGTCVPPSMIKSEPDVLSAAASESAVTVCKQRRG